jgi:hypothetical protein
MNSQPKLTYVDACVLIAAAKGTEEAFQQALAVLADPGRVFAASHFLRLEVLPHAEYYKKKVLTDFYDEFFRCVSCWTRINESLVQAACEEAGKSDMGSMDALHMVSAAAVGADEFVTHEKESKPFHRSGLVKVVSVRG